VTLQAKNCADTHINITVEVDDINKKRQNKKRQKNTTSTYF